MNGRMFFVLVLKVGFALVALVALLFVLGTLLWPSAMDAVEAATGFFFSPELAARWSIAMTLGIGVLLLFLWQRVSGERLYGIVAWTLLAALVLLAPMFAWDPSPLKDEGAWIRYPTAIALFGNGILLWLLSRRFNQGERWPRAKEWMWVLLSVGFVFAGADELLQVHELIGGAIERSFHLPHITTDLITAGYGLIGLVMIVLAFRFLKDVLTVIPKSFFVLAIAGLVLFGISTIFDTLDVLVWDGITWTVNHAYSGGGTPLPRLFDFWYAPGLLLNSFEEVFEFFAGLLFSLATLSVLMGDLAQRKEVTPQSRRRFRFAVASLVVLAALPSVFTRDMFSSTSPFADDTKAQSIADGDDGLYHTDGLAYDAVKGLYIANESRPDYLGRENGPGVFHLVNGIVERLPDPDKVLKDTDSVTVFDGAPYASDGATGAIFRFDEDTQRYVLLSNRDRGLKVPEAMMAHDNALYVLDEHFRSVARVERDGSVRMEFPKHAQWQNPEDLLWVDELKGFLVTDDRNGTIFLFRSENDFSVWADRSDGLKETESLTRIGDTIYVSDNGRGEIVGFDLEGKVTERKRLRWLYRDVQGIATNGADIYAVTSNAYGSVSFMPGIVWQFDAKE